MDERAEPARYSVRLLGPPSVTDELGQPVPGLGFGKPLAMLAFLATRGEVRRDELIELLWGGNPEANARNAFRQALHRLRWALGEEVIPQDRDRVGLRRVPGRLISVHRDRFLACIGAGQLLKPAQLYRGDFLEGVTLGEPSFDQWVQYEPTHVRNH